jgi:uncharacterized delta-60 repeat protein
MSARSMKLSVIVLVMVLAALACAISRAPANSPSPSDGIVTIAVGPTGSAQANGAQLDADGNIVITGTYWNKNGVPNLYALRLLETGVLDSTFGTGGITLTTFGSKYSSWFGLMDIGPDGKIVSAGETNPGSGSNLLAVVRYNTNGSLDTTFNGKGWVTATNPDSNGVAVQADGKVLVTGVSSGTGGFFTVRFNVNGTTDTSFGSGGSVATLFPGYPSAESFAVTLQDGGFIVGGRVYPGPASGITRYLPTGVIDTSFDSSGANPGYVTLLPAGHSNCDFFDMTVDPIGRIIECGQAQNSTTDRSDIALARYNTDGSVDTTFGSGNGYVTWNLANPSNLAGEHLAEQSDGKILVASPGPATLTRFNEDGSLDTTFGAPTGAPGNPPPCKGYLATPMTLTPTAILVQADGKIVLVGYQYDSSNAKYTVTLLRYNTDGTLDTTF